MKKTTAIATFVLTLSAGAAGAGALNMSGSDTLFVMTKSMLNGITSPVLAACPGTTSIKYIGGGSSVGESAMQSGSQQIAPMSRFLKTATCTGSGSSNGANAQGIVHSLDALSIVGADGTIGNCGGIASNTTIAVADSNGVAGMQCPGCSGTNYTFADWKDALSVLYAGVHHAGSGKDCNSDVRNSLAASYSKMFQTPASCTATPCTQIRHAYRRDDVSGTTDTFLGLLGLPAISTNPFCNGADTEDNDPIRRPCDSTEQVCSRNGDLGLVLAVNMPEEASASEKFGPPCNDGVFKWMLPPFSASVCPNNKGFVFAKCLTPVDTSGKGGCLMDEFGTTPVGSGTTDPRVYNLILRASDGTVLLNSEGKEMEAAYYRIHQTAALSAGGTACTQASMTLQIGCLMQASKCSIGFAGREAGELISGVSPNLINGVIPTVTSVRALLTDPNNTLATTYRFSRKLYINSMKGFNNVSGEELNLAKCFNTQSRVDIAANAAGFFTLGVAPFCEDFNEQSNCAQGSNSATCSGFALGTL